MANPEHLELLKQGIEAWNQWRINNPAVQPDLSETVLSGADLYSANLSGANLSGALLDVAFLRGANLSEANLYVASLYSADLYSVDLQRANLSGANLSGVDLCEANLSEANLNVASLSRANLSGANLSGAVLCGVNLSGAVLRGANLSGANLSRANLSGLDLRGMNLSGANLSGLDLRGMNLSGVNLYGVDLSCASLIGVNLSRANLSGAVLQGANLSRASLSETNLSEANLNETNLSGLDLRALDLRKTTLSGADLSGTNLSRANLSEATLSAAKLIQLQALGTNLEKSILTAACLQDWNTNSETNFEGVICEYIYLRANQQERRPREGNFKPGEFAALFQQAVDTIDLIFVDGLDWQSFFASLQEIRQQYDGSDINIQAIEKKSSGAFVIRLEVSESLDRADLQRHLNTTYEENQQLRSQLLKTEGKLEGYKEQLDDFQQKVLEGMNSPKFDLRGAQIAGGVADTVQGDQIGGIINNQANEIPSLAEAVTEIQTLLKSLEVLNPDVTETQQTAYLDALIPPKQRERFIGALKSANGAEIEEIPYGTVLKALVEGWQRLEGESVG
ncbi:MAG: hypothetical protein F6K11_11705 [Leptolyngbya sp. SIO3F4]|nr:hypothetical protein [Leptolyngbya sp. SIO3F4]